ncbi:MAG: 1-acyl-sn-glycerol-3-phosphate acyltransferase [Bacteroidetes bacterium]|nr:1-acyl-sn-glycerol-3-phosphate acyltransferase [Bacteroidota bacterium]
MLWHITKYYLCFVIAVFFRRIKIKNAKSIKVKGPVVIAMNHPNAFMDPIAFTTNVFPPRVRYLARGDAFKKGIVSIILESFGIIPIFRIQDGGKEGLKKNDETYDRVNTLLKRNQKIIIFAEGLCIQERRLRPLKKGVPRMVFGAMDAYGLENLTVVPVGVNYSKPSQFRSNLFFNLGEPIKMSDYTAAYKDAPAKTMNQFLADLAPKMKELIIHINHPHNELLIEHIEEIYKHTYFKQHQLQLNNVEHDFMFSTAVVNSVNQTEDTHPEKLKILLEKTTAYQNTLKKYRLRDWLINPAKESSLHYGVFYLRFLLLVVSFPLYLRGLLGSYIPYALTEFITNKKVKVIEFKASFLMGIGAFMFLLFGLLQFFVAKAIAPNAWWGLFVLIVTVVTGLFCLWLSPFRKKTWGILRTLRLKSQQPSVFEDLRNQRQSIIRSFEELM